MDDTVYMVRCTTEAACWRELKLICERMDAQVATRPTAGTGRGWIARAVPAPTKAPAESDGRGPGVSG